MQRTETQRRLNFYCQVIIVLLCSIAVRLWLSPVELLPQAQAQFMDSGAQRQQIIKTGERTNELLTEIHNTLKGTMTVRLQAADVGESKKEGSKKRSP